MIRAGAYWIDPARIVFIEVRDNGAYVHLAGAQEALALLPDEWQELKAAIEAGKGGDDGTDNSG